MTWETDGLSPHSTVTFNDERHKQYTELYPDGFELVWVGHWKGDPRITPLLSAKDATTQDTLAP